MAAAIGDDLGPIKADIASNAQKTNQVIRAADEGALSTPATFSKPT
jgi:hypothetical protein